MVSRYEIDPRGMTGRLPIMGSVIIVNSNVELAIVVMGMVRATHEITFRGDL